MTDEKSTSQTTSDLCICVSELLTALDTAFEGTAAIAAKHSLDESLRWPMAQYVLDVALERSPSLGGFSEAITNATNDDVLAQFVAGHPLG